MNTRLWIFLRQNGIPVPRRGIASTMHEALHVAGEIGYPVILKAQVLVGRPRPCRRHQDRVLAG